MTIDALRAALSSRRGREPGARWCCTAFRSTCTSRFPPSSWRSSRRTRTSSGSRTARASASCSRRTCRRSRRPFSVFTGNAQLFQHAMVSGARGGILAGALFAGGRWRSTSIARVQSGDESTANAAHVALLAARREDRRRAWRARREGGDGWRRLARRAGAIAAAAAVGGAADRDRRASSERGAGDRSVDGANIETRMTRKHTNRTRRAIARCAGFDSCFFVIVSVVIAGGDAAHLDDAGRAPAPAGSDGDGRRASVLRRRAARGRIRHRRTDVRVFRVRRRVGDAGRRRGRVAERDSALSRTTARRG